MDVKGWIKAHPWSTGALVIGGGIVFIMLSGVLKGGGSTVAVSSSGVSDAQLAAQTQVQLAQISAQANNAQVSGAVSAASIEAQTQAAIAALSADVAKYQVSAERDINLSNIAAQTQMFTIQNQTALDAARLQSMVDTTNINANKDVSLAQINANTATTSAIITALTPKAPEKSVWEKVLDDRPDVAAAWTSTASKNPDYHGSETAWVQDWYTKWGAPSGYVLPH